MVEVAGFVDVVVFLVEVVALVVVEVAVGFEGAQFQDRFGAGESPAGAGDVHPVFDEVSAGSLDDAGGDRPPILQGGGVVEVGCFVGQVGGGVISRFAVGLVEAGVGRLAADRACDLGGVSLEHSGCLAVHPTKSRRLSSSSG